MALSELCGLYYTPVIRFLEAEGRPEDLARELAQEFFARVLAGNGFDQADPAAGKFRSYLWGALKHFLMDRRKSERRLKRGGGHLPASLDALENPENGEEGMQVAEVRNLVPDAAFDRDWALVIIRRALEALENAWRDAGKPEQFQALKPWLLGDAAGETQAQVASRLGMAEGALKVSVHRLRRHLRESVRLEIAHTLRDSAQVDEELRSLMEALRV